MATKKRGRSRSSRSSRSSRRGRHGNVAKHETLVEMAQRIHKEWQEGPVARRRIFELQAIAPLARRAGLTPEQALSLIEKTRDEIRAKH
jgi:hypothetical protein